MEVEERVSQGPGVGRFVHPVRTRNPVPQSGAQSCPGSV